MGSVKILKNIVLFDTSVGSLNHGDEIIMESFFKNGRDILDNNFIARFPTHTPCFHVYQQTVKNPRYVFVKNADYKFICGTNLLSNKMYIPWHFWNINIFNSKCYNNAVLVGVGISSFKKNNENFSAYSKMLFSNFLSKTYKHSVRDERTKGIVENLLGAGSAINTGCPTIWGLTREHCNQIKTKKSQTVVFTLTDYSIDRQNDQNLIDTLLTNYKAVYFWPQGTRDLNYFNSLDNTNRITVISPSVAAYSRLLSELDIDYVGTRLHAGIYAMQHKVRSIILVVDNRATDMAETYNINTVWRNASHLGTLLNSEIETNININQENIKEWKSQFLASTI